MGEEVVIRLTVFNELLPVYCRELTSLPNSSQSKFCLYCIILHTHIYFLSLDNSMLTMLMID